MIFTGCVRDRSRTEMTGSLPRVHPLLVLIITGFVIGVGYHAEPGMSIPRGVPRADSRDKTADRE